MIIHTGWASVKYKGRKMDHYKNLWLKSKAKREAILGQQISAANIEENYPDKDDVEDDGR